jgi:poly-gamma-glutamate capsule biosynthesis protein CapA/YwtB (metallophosphatase superfamily)
VSWSVRAVAVSALLVLAVDVGVLARASPPAVTTTYTGPVLAGQVVDELGRGIAGASVDVGSGDSLVTGATGRFSAPAFGGPRLITAWAPGHLPRTQAAAPGAFADLTLTSQADSTVSMRFGGDVMFGRRYLDRDGDGDRSDALLPVGGSVAEHAALLQHVRPLLEDADLAVVNLESPVQVDPSVDPRAPRPAAYHPTKEFVFASAPQSVQALLDAGVDAVSLGNNHVYDALEDGLAQTLTALDAAGLPHFGAGRTEDEAWAPAVVERKGQRIALIGCTTITGSEHAVPYVADPTRGGAARCTQERMDLEVRAARARADVVVVMVHGGEEYEREQTDVVRELSAIARGAGAALVVNGHPHVVGGIVTDGVGLTAESTGNLLFDQTVWPTFLSYLLRVDVRAGAPVSSTVDPIMLEGYVPRPTVGDVADAASRRAAGLGGPSDGMRLQQPGAAWDLRTVPAQRQQVALPAGTVERLASGWWVSGVPPDAPVAVGEDLLWTGSFEDMDTDPTTAGAHEWSYGSNAALLPRAACSGEAGMELQRTPDSQEDAVLTPTHRQLVPAGTSLSLLVDVRRASAGSTVELAMFGDTEGPSTATSVLPVPEGAYDEQCRTVRIDVQVPAGTVAVQPFVRLAAPVGEVRTLRLAVDDVRLVAWAAPGTTGRGYDTVEARGDAVLEVADDRPARDRGPFGAEPETG